ncbi:uncharacterized protein G6M90_00g113870 [Metarhizium brunneum]|uniref:Uncharacterized protein n=1 Tax=Metarhizium brunneum TaxID=500148 RepID=A0A7D5Z575_9HYPO|nr:hypothetical protein G6M90_00g113870 [Metarhizium brunneum]
MKAAAIILASLIGNALAAPAGSKSKAPAPGSSDNEKPKSKCTPQTIDEYCQVMQNTSNGLFDKQFCLDAFKSCGNPASLDDAKSKNCAGDIMADKYLGREPRPVSDSKKEDESTKQPNTSTQNRQ